MSWLPFVGLTFAISLVGFMGIVLVPGAESPDSGRGLPFWLVTVWGPTLAALILSARAGQLSGLLGRAVEVASVPPAVWLLIVSPLALVALLPTTRPVDGPELDVATVAIMVLFNLVLGPLGEELGWRGVLQEQLNPRLGWLLASLVIGGVWLVWHLPLWTIDSPHAEISLHLFAIHCVMYAVIIGAAYRLSGGSILPAILLHLTFNVASNLAPFVGYREPDSWFAASLWPYASLCVLMVAVVHLKTNATG